MIFTREFQIKRKPHPEFLQTPYRVSALLGTSCVVWDARGGLPL